MNRAPSLATCILAVTLGWQPALAFELSFESENAHVFLNALALGPDGEIVAAGRRTLKSPDGTQSDDAYVFARNRDGSLRWERLLEDSGNHEFYTLNALPGGGWVLAGEYRSPSDERFCLVVRIDGVGQPVWDRLIKASGACVPTDADVHRDSGIAIIALSGAYIRLDFDGNVVLAREIDDGDTVAFFRTIDLFANGATIVGATLSLTFENSIGLLEFAGTESFFAVVDAAGGEGEVVSWPQAEVFASSRIAEDTVRFDAHTFSSVVSSQMGVDLERVGTGFIYLDDATDERIEAHAVFHEQDGTSVVIGGRESLVAAEPVLIITAPSPTDRDAWFLKTAGSERTERTYGTPDRDEYLTHIVALPHGGYVVAGVRRGEYSSAWIFSLDADGNPE